VPLLTRCALLAFVNEYGRDICIVVQDSGSVNRTTVSVAGPDSTSTNELTPREVEELAAALAAHQINVR
jgi:hypothetical protein